MIKLIDFLNLFDDDNISFDIIVLVDSRKNFDDIMSECLITINRNYKGGLLYYCISNVYIVNKNKFHVVLKGVFNID